MKPLMVVDVEAEHARKIVGEHYDVVLYKDAKARVVKARSVLYWPITEDATRAQLLRKQALEVKVLQADGYTPSAMSNLAWHEFVAWAKPKILIITVAASTEDPAPSTLPVIAKVQELGLAVNNSGNPIGDLANIMRFLEKHETGETLWYDEFHHRYFKSVEGILHEWGDHDTLALTQRLQDEYGFRKLSDEIVYKAVVLHGHTWPRNEPKTWFNSLEWDGIDRIGSFFVDCLGAEPSSYMSAVSHNFWVGMVARVYQPGCQNDHMVVLEGPQNAGKTSALRIIGGRWYAEASESVQSKDFYMILQGRMLVEISELDAFSKAEVNRIKQVISCPIDRYRAPYMRAASDYGRTAIFAGTTNEDAYLRDATGARRFWPVRCGKIDLEAIKTLRPQLFAEAVKLYLDGAKWYQTPIMDTLAVQESRRDRDAWEDIIASSVQGPDHDFVTVEEVGKMIGITTDKLDRRTQIRIANALKKSNFRREMRRVIGKVTRGWLRLQDTNGDV